MKSKINGCTHHASKVVQKFAAGGSVRGSDGMTASQRQSSADAGTRGVGLRTGTTIRGNAAAGPAGGTATMHMMGSGSSQPGGRQTWSNFKDPSGRTMPGTSSLSVGGSGNDAYRTASAVSKNYTANRQLSSNSGVGTVRAVAPKPVAPKPAAPSIPISKPVPASTLPPPQLTDVPGLTTPKKPAMQTVGSKKYYERVPQVNTPGKVFRDRVTPGNTSTWDKTGQAKSKSKSGTSTGRSTGRSGGGYGGGGGSGW